MLMLLLLCSLSACPSLWDISASNSRRMFRFEKERKGGKSDGASRYRVMAYLDKKGREENFSL